ncbi:MAG: cysteine--tRNA ligase [Bifidobacteriaceae bacterium]|jgi:cysteinyl-tRNA synthetase|nr:cysteine--tRNA ligase [Bifidobacteriaceae bacterium]
MLVIYNSADDRKQKFQPLKKNIVSLYLCGPTVQSYPHIGHIRSAISFDIIVRWLRFLGFKVLYIRNITDINDKIFAKAQVDSLAWWEVASKYANAFRDAYKVLGCLDPTYEPLASAHISQMIDLVAKILDKGKAYIVQDGIYFDTVSYKDYGQLTNQINQKTLMDEEEHSQYKRNSRDFALWKFTNSQNKQVYPVYKSPWGQGRPGWHLECSAMAKTYLGQSFDIHGGGLDLRFPHHENEQAQSRSVGYGFAKSWLHTAWVTQKGTKMSKSLGNGLLVKDILQKTTPLVLRFSLGSSHYRSQIEWSDETLVQSNNSLRNIIKFVEKLTQKYNKLDIDFKLTVAEDFAEAMNDDFNVPLALSVLYKQIKKALKEFDESRQINSKLPNFQLTDLEKYILSELNILGFNPLSKIWQNNSLAEKDNIKYKTVLENLVKFDLSKRIKAKQIGDFQQADAVRDRLTAAGLNLEDKPNNKTEWYIK